MTKKFDKAVKEIIEEEYIPPHNIIDATFKDLPDRRPYGFWLYPDGQTFAIVMGPMEHLIVSKQIIYSNPKFDKKFRGLLKKGFPNPALMLEKEGYVRVVRDILQKKFILDLKPVPVAKRNKYIKLMKDIAAMYEWGIDTNV